jgi:hypothetical protein
MNYQIKTLDSIKYTINPDCAYFCPYKPYQNMLLVGLYHLIDEKE